MTSPSLTRATAAGLGWSLGTVVATTALQLIYTATISRLLEPAEFGVMAAALLGLRFVTYFSRFGLGSAIIQRPELSDRDESTALRLSVAIGCLAGLVTIAVSPLIAALLQLPDVVQVMRWMALAVLMGAVAVVPEALLRRRMQFRALGAVQIVSYAIGYLGVGILSARAGWGVWSLVAANITQVGSKLALELILAKVRVRARFSKRSARATLRFGGFVTATGFLEFFSSTLDTLAIGRYAGAAGLGQYSRATLIVALPVEQVTTATSRVLLPSFSRVNTAPSRFAPAVTTSMGLLSAVVIVPTAMIAAGAPSLVSWLLGPGWEQAAGIVPYVAVAYGLGLLTNTPAMAAEALGAVERKLLIQIAALVTTASLLALVILTDPKVERLAIAWGIGQLCRHLYYWVWMFGLLGISRAGVARRYAASAILALAAAAPVVVVVRVQDVDGFGALAASSAVGIALGSALFLSPIGSGVRSDLSGLRRRMAG